MDSKHLRQLFLDFMSTKGHQILPSASLLPKEDPTLLFVNSGMYPLVPYLMGNPHPGGSRLADSQKCIRTLDIEEVGDNRHLSFFEMLGSWSLGDYSKYDSISWGFEFLTSKEWLGIDPNRIYVTVYKGFGEVSEDTESIEAWVKMFDSVGITADIGSEYDFSTGQKNSENKYIHKITKKSGKDNWWGLPYKGPCGPCSEIYYLLNHHSTDFETELFTNMDLESIKNFIENDIVEIWNHVFMEYEGEWGTNNEPINLKPLAQKNVDTGMGFERLLAVINGLDTAHKTDTLRPISVIAEKWSQK